MSETMTRCVFLLALLTLLQQGCGAATPTPHPPTGSAAADTPGDAERPGSGNSDGDGALPAGGGAPSSAGDDAASPASPLPPPAGGCPAPPAAAKYVTPDTMADVLRELEPGDTMVLRDGTYPSIVIKDHSGTADAPITIMAEHERQALVRGDGRQAGLRISGSGHWLICGLRCENVDLDKSHDEIYGAMAGYITGSHHITLRRNLFRLPNAYGNNACLKLGSGTHDCLIEENELYDYHRNGLEVHNGKSATGTRANTLRRNYSNSRGREWKGKRWGPNYGIACYRSIDTVVENNVLEYTSDEGDPHRIIQNPGTNNRFYGNIVLNAKHGFGHFGAEVLMENNLVIDPAENGVYAHSIKDFVLRNNTFIRPGDEGVSADNNADRSSTSLTAQNNLVVGSAGVGYRVSDPSSFDFVEISYCGGWDNKGGTWGPGTDGREHTPPEADPGFAGTYVYVPSSSPYSGAGANGADVGANILYRYEDEQLTDVRLWDPGTGAFPHGAIVAGVNDKAGHSLFDLHQRLNVSPATLPPGY